MKPLRQPDRTLRKGTAGTGLPGWYWLLWVGLVVFLAILMI